MTKDLPHSGFASIPSELVERLENASAGSRELDAEVWRFATGDVVGTSGAVGRYYKAPETDWVMIELPPVTTSLDAALALAERVLGESAALDGLFYILGTERGGIKRLPLALCIAILKATPAASESAVGMSPKGECTKKEHDHEV